LSHKQRAACMMTDTAILSLKYPKLQSTPVDLESLPSLGQKSLHGCVWDTGSVEFGIAMALPC
jgi:hypothetical protein